MQKLNWIIGMCALLGCLSFFQAAEAAEITTLAEVAGKPVSVQVTIGEQWAHSFRMFLKKITTTPQIAIWAEDADGKYLETLYVTKKFATQDWGIMSGAADATHRVESLPYWMFKRGAAGVPSPTKKAPLPDAVTSASPKEDFTLKTNVPGETAEVFVLMELNLSFDENDAYPEKAKEQDANYNGVSGQPAVVYRAKVNLAAPGRYDMTLIGHSSASGKDGQLDEDVSSLTTALQIVKQAVVVVE